MIVETFCSIVTIVVLCVAMAVQPKRARCPDGWYVEGVRRSGAFTCKRKLVGGFHDSPGVEDTAVQPPGELSGRIYCTGGARPIFVYDRTARTVGCQR